MFSALLSGLRWSVSGATWKKIAVVTLAGLFVLMCYYFASALDSPDPKKTPAATADTLQNGQVFWGWVIAIVIAIALVWLYRHRRADGAKRGEILISPIFLTPIALFLVWAFIAFLLPEVWQFVWADQILFWAINLGATLLVQVGSIGNKASSIAVKVLGVILVAGILAQLNRNPEAKKWLAGTNAPWANTKTSARITPLDAVAIAETGNQHFGADGKVIIGQDGKIGRYKILPIHSQAGEACDGMDLYNEAQNLACAEKLQAKQGLRPWFSSMKGLNGWEDKVSKGYQYTLNRVVSNKTEWTSQTPLPADDQVWKTYPDEGYTVLINASTDGPVEMYASENLSQTYERLEVPVKKRVQPTWLAFKATGTSIEITVVVKPKSR